MSTQKRFFEDEFRCLDFEDVFVRRSPLSTETRRADRAHAYARFVSLNRFDATGCRSQWRFPWSARKQLVAESPAESVPNDRLPGPESEPVYVPAAAHQHIWLTVVSAVVG